MQQIEIGKTVNFNRYSEFGKSVVEGKIISISGDLLKMKIDTDKYKHLEKEIIVPRQNLIQ